jgi:hypothetical protein
MLVMSEGAQYERFSSQIIVMGSQDACNERMESEIPLPQACLRRSKTCLDRLFQYGWPRVLAV